jgi:hypothetical protein
VEQAVVLILVPEHVKMAVKLCVSILVAVYVPVLAKKLVQVVAHHVALECVRVGVCHVKVHVKVLQKKWCGIVLIVVPEKTTTYSS